MSGAPLLIPNLGAEETPHWRKLLREPAPACMARLWTWLFAEGSEVEPAAFEHAWPPDLRGANERATDVVAPAFAWLPSGEHAVAWIPTEAERHFAERAGRVLSGPTPDCVARVHDKAFAQRVADAGGHLPRPLRGLVEIFEVDALRDADLCVERVRQCVDGWPEWTGGRFALKPRLATSGRGRVPGDRARFDEAAIRGALPRLIERGGALLEPWLERTQDLSVQLHVAPGGELVLLGTLEQQLSTAGLYQGHAGQVDWRGRVSSGSKHEEVLLEAGCDVARHAASEGFFGPCGVDAFAFRTLERGGEARDWLRPVTEFNARFTTGTVVLGLLRRVHRRLGLQPGEVARFEFRLDASAAAGSPAPAPGEPSDARLIRLWSPGDAVRPELRVWTP